MEAALSHLSQAPPLLSRSNSNFFNFRNPNLIITKFIPNLHKFSSSLSSSSAVVDSDSPTIGSRARNDFATIHQGVDGFNRIYFDNAKSSKKPDYVLKAMNDYYESYNSNVHRGIHALSAKATDAYEQARLKVAKFLNAKEYREIVFTRNATEAINLVAYSWGLSNIKSGDEILLTIAEHHSAISPWQFVAKRTGAALKYVNLNKDEILDVEQLKKLLSTKTKLLVIHHASHILGTVMPIREVVAWSHEVGAKVLIDACQSVPHMAVDVQKLDADFLVASSHKMCGPTGIGFLYGKSEILTSMPPYLGGGEMIADVFEDYSTYAEPPSRFEAGTPAIAEAIGLGSAIDYLSSIGMQNIQDYEEELAKYLYHGLLSIPDIRIYGPPASNIDRLVAICSFNVDNVSSEDIATHLNEKIWLWFVERTFFSPVASNFKTVHQKPFAYCTEACTNELLSQHYRFISCGCWLWPSLCSASPPVLGYNFKCSSKPPILQH